MASILYKLEPLYRHFPEIRGPTKHVSFKEKLMWVGIALMLFFVMGQITPLGAAPPDQSTLGLMQIVFASQIGTLMSIGIGPIVTASIILQLLVGAKMIHLDLHNPDDRAVFQGTQKLLVIVVALFESYAFVGMGAIPVTEPGNTGLILFVTIQVAFASILLMFLDEIVSKWGIGSGIGLFIAAGISQKIIWDTFRILPGNPGVIPNFLGRLAEGHLDLLILWPFLMTIVIFLIVAYFESLKIEIPLSYGRFGVGARYPLKFFYTSNIPVILASAVLMNATIFANIFAGAGIPILGQVDQQKQIIQTMEGGGLGYLITIGDLHGTLSPGGIGRLADTEKMFDNRVDLSCDGAIEVRGNSAFCVDRETGEEAPISCGGTVEPKIRYGTGEVTGYYCSTGGIDFPSTIFHLIVYAIVFIGFCVLFGVFWVMMSSMDPETVSQQMEQSGLQIPGFRADRRVIKRVLDRYIPQLTVVSAVAVGLLAVTADLTGALGTGTGILLTVGILYRMYEEIQREQMSEVSPAIRKLMGQGR
jgi:preprotein translocase subunit SecY